MPEDYVEGYAWIIMAAANGLEEASKNKVVFQRQMNSSPITAAQQRVKEIQAELGRKKSAAP